MQITHTVIPVRDLFRGYVNKLGEGVTAMDGTLTIRPPYQREFIYDVKRQQAVLESVMAGFPLNSIYFAKSPEGWEVLDGQQRIMSICEFLAGSSMIVLDNKDRTYTSLSEEEKALFLDYPLQVYLCDGAHDEKLKWFQRINVAGMELTRQELRNAVYAGKWLSSAKKYFSSGQTGLAHRKGYSAYLSGASDRQEWLETALLWTGYRPEVYMAAHQEDSNANALVTHFENVLEWVKKMFPVYRAEMSRVDWGLLYRLYGNMGFLGRFDPESLETRVSALMADDDVLNKRGIYHYVLSGQEKHLNIRRFTSTMKRSAYTRQGGVCPLCKGSFELEQMEGDHILPWSQGGHTTPDNLQMLCRQCNREKATK